MNALPARVRGLVVAHPAFVALLAAAALLRLAVAIAYAPALLYSDSSGYLSMAFDRTVVGVAPLRPSGYPLLMHVLSPFGHSLASVTTAQHIGGLVTGVLVYALLLQLGVRRALAWAAAALVLLDAYALSLEQYILAEAPFTLALTASAYLTLTARGSGRRLAAGGVLLAAAALMRPVAVFALPVWLIYVAWTRPSRRAALSAAAAALVPVLAYCAAHAATTGTFSLTQADGWFLYGRVGEITRCPLGHAPARERTLCRATAHHRNKAPSWFIFSPHSPAREQIRTLGTDVRRQAETNGELRDFAYRVIAHRPAAYAGIVARDFAHYFTPGVATRYGDDRTLDLPAHRPASWDDPAVRRRLVPGYATRASFPAPVLHAYGHVIHTPRWLLAALVLAALAAMVAAPARRRELFLLVGAALAMLLGSVATAGFALRYLVPVVPLIACAGAIAIGELARGRRRRSAGAGRRTGHGVGEPALEREKPLTPVDRGEQRSRSRSVLAAAVRVA